MPINYTGSGGGIPRKTAKIFAKNADANDMTVFGSTLANNTQYSTDLDSIQSSHYEVGWREAVISNLNYPLLSDMNAVQHTLSQQIAYGLQHGIPEYDSGTTYFAYDKVQYNDIIYTALQDNFSNKLPSDTDYWAKWYDRDYFLNKTQVTNCVIEAPNGVADASNGNFIIKSGVTILVAAGRNADGTQNNYSYTYTQDVTTPIVYGYGCGVVLASTSGTINLIPNREYIISRVAPTSPVNNTHWYNPITGYIMAWSTTTNSWSYSPQIPVAYFVTTSNQLYAFKSLRALRIYTDNDQSELSGLGMPKLTRYELSLGASGTQYVAPANGWVFVNGTSIGTADSPKPFIYIYDGDEGLGTSVIAPNQGFKIAAYMPIAKGDKFKVYYGNTSISYIGFSLAEGEV